MKFVLLIRFGWILTPRSTAGFTTARSAVEASFQYSKMPSSPLSTGSQDISHEPCHPTLAQEDVPRKKKKHRGGRAGRRNNKKIERGLTKMVDELVASDGEDVGVEEQVLKIGDGEWEVVVRKSKEKGMGKGRG